MLVSGGKLLAIDQIYTDSLTVIGDGVTQALYVNTDIIATNDVVNTVSSTLYDDISTVSSNFDNYYTKEETSGSEQLAEEFDAIKKSIVSPYNITSLTPDILSASVSADDEGVKSYVVSATNATQVELEFDGVYDPETNKVATVETVDKVKNVILQYGATPTQTYSDLLEIMNTGKLYVFNENEIVLANNVTDNKIEFTYVNSGQQLCYYSISSDLTWNHSIDTLTNDHKVSVANGTTPDYLQNVLVSDSDELAIIKVDNQLRVSLNLTGESDPKLTTMYESQINDSLDNYGWWNLTDPVPVWGEAGRTNVLLYAIKRLSDAQGSLTVCNFAFTNSWGTTRPIFRIGVFDLNMTLLGSSDYFVYDSTVGQFVGQIYGDTLVLAQNANAELSVKMHEETVGSLKIKRNTRYIIELLSCGLSFAGKTQTGSGITSNYVYDYALENNLMTSKSGVLDWWTDLLGKQQASKIPYLSFGASEIY